MCLSIPSKIKSIDTEMNTCVVDTMGVERSASLDLIGRSANPHARYRNLFPYQPP